MSDPINKEADVSKISRRDIQRKIVSRLDMSAGPDACWLWPPSWYGHGRTFRPLYDYGTVLLRPIGTVRAHRIIYRLTRGPIPNGNVVMHKCDNPACCNPKHLLAGTYADNMHDAMRKGRHIGAKTAPVRDRPYSKRFVNIKTERAWG